ncbi:MAG: ECF-type sigma factor [Pseudomonadota bacterium]
MSDAGHITQLLQQWSGGDEAALDALSPMVYEELHRLARRAFSGEKASHTLQPTALVNEAFLKLVNVDVSWQDRAHFFGLAARMMRRLLINHANARTAKKRGGKEAINITLDESSVAGDDNDLRLLEIDAAITKLAEIDERKAQIVELKYFGGLTGRELAAVTGLSTTTLGRELKLTMAWLKAELGS